MKLIDYIEDRIPGYALSYLVNGDASGIDTEDQENADSWYNDCRDRLSASYPDAHIDLILRDGDEGSFTWNPAFGLACDCVRGMVAAFVPNDSPIPAIASPWDDEPEESEND